jgi:hypothetical protein
MKENYYWLSFVKDDENIGCCNVSAIDMQAAIIKTHILGINPGGEVLVIEIPELELPENKLISKAELVALDYKNAEQVAEELNIDVEQLPGDYVCPCCNSITCNQHN